MKAVFLDVPRAVSIRDVEQRPLQRGWARIRVDAVGLCDDDLDAFRGTVEHQHYPIVLGRDAVGTIVEMDGETNAQDGIIQFPGGSGGFGGFGGSGEPRVGSRVVIIPENFADRELMPAHVRPTGGCPHPNRRTRLGFNVHGALSEYAVAPVEQCVVIPDGISTKDAVFTQSARQALYAADKSRAGEDDVVAIVGASDTGIIAAQIVRSRGARPILVDIAQTHLELAQSLGFEHVVNPFSTYAAEEIEWITSGDMADAVIDTTGNAEVFANCLDFAAEGATVVYTRMPTGTAAIDPKIIVGKELCVVGCRNCVARTPDVFSLMEEGIIRVDSLVSTHLPLDAAPLIIPCIAEHPEHYMRVVLAGTLSDSEDGI